MLSIRTCLIAERKLLSAGWFFRYRSGLSPPSPVFDLAPMRFIAIARVVWASQEMLPNDIAPDAAL